MLVATQLLAGSGVSVHLCFSSDGSFCCIDGGAASCSCCKPADEPKKSLENQLPAGNARKCNAGCCKVANNEWHGEEKYPPALAEAPCGCTHIPLALASGEQSIASRSGAAPSERVSHQFSALWLPATLLNAADLSLLPPRLEMGRQPHVPNYTLVVVSIVVIRC